MKGETWYPIKCDGVAKSMVMDQKVNDGRTLRAGLLEEFKEDNSNATVDCLAKKVAWLSKNSEKPVGSLVVWLSRKEAAEHLLWSQTVLFGASAAFCSRFEAAENNGPCYRCNKYGHKQGRCTRKMACGICAKEHQTRSCNNKENPKCPACAGAHTIFDRKCPLHPSNQRKARESESRGAMAKPGGATAEEAAVEEVVMEDMPATTC